MRHLALASALLLATAQAAPRPELTAEIARVRTQVAGLPKGQQASLITRLDRADAALNAGRAYQALYLLESPFEIASGMTFAAASTAKTQDAFLKVWTDVGVPKARSGASGRFPAVIDALAEAAEDRSISTYHASRPYGQDAGVESGLYYIGESRALMDFAAFARSGSWPAAGRRPAFRSIAPEIAAFDLEVTTKYETMERANHPTYIRASAALKQARSLDEHHALEGALFEYLLSRYLFAPLRGPAAADATRERIDAARAALPAGENHSIAELFLQFADEGVTSDNADLRRAAAAAVEDVIPAYLAAIAPSRPMTATTPAAAVTITLVRWPFT